MIQFKVDDIKVNILDTTPQSTDEEDFGLLVEYISVLQEIDMDLNQLHESS